MPQPVRIRARVEEVIGHAPGLRSLILKPERLVPRFRPGQFLHLAVDPWDPSAHWPDSRPLSVASPPESRDLLRVTVSEVGRFTSRIMAATAGDTVWLKLPYGEFVVRSSRAEPAVLVAGGTGVAPFISMATSDLALGGPVRLLYGVRRPELLIYRDILDEAARRNPDLQWEAFVEEDAPAGARSGRLSAEAAVTAAEVTGLPAAAAFYLSGPPEMIAALIAGLAEAGVGPDRIRVDAWE
jgi:ferredoxin-NADP reductase